MNLLAALSCVVLVSSAALVAAMPTFEHLAGWDSSSIGSLVPGASFIEAIGQQNVPGSRPSKHLNVREPGIPGNITTVPASRARTNHPTLFYIHRDQLWQLINSTTIYAVNAYNVSSSPDDPLQLISTPDSRKQHYYGSWRWLGTMLIYEEGKLSNGGLFYDCPIKGSKDRSTGIFTFIQPTKPPEGCAPVTLHGFNRIFMDQTDPPA